jgi:hypothetical protein
MRRIFRHISSPSMIVVLVALFVAMGGAAYAAVILPVNSVGTNQLKNSAVTGAKLASSAVTSAKVKDGSLLALDFKAGQLPAAAQGPKGDTGATGPQGPKGDVGAIGHEGPKGAGGSTGAPGPKGDTGSAGAPGSSGVVTTAGFMGNIGTIGAPTTGYVFAGSQALVTTTAGQRLTGAGEMPLGSSGSTMGEQIQYGLCYAPSTGTGTLTNFVGGGYSIAPVFPDRRVFSAAATVSPGAGSWRVGMCVQVSGSHAIDSNDYANGWVQVTN